MLNVVDVVYQAYSARDDARLVAALESLKYKLESDVQRLGPTVVTFWLQGYPNLAGIINKIGKDVNATTHVKLTHLAGYITAYMCILTQMVASKAVDLAETKLSVGRDKKSSVDLITMILKTTLAHSGARATSLIKGVSRSAKVSPRVVKRHVLKLVSLRMLERLNDGSKATVYRTSYLGEEVLARRMKPYEIALFFVDEAARHEGLRAAMKDEIRRTWPK